MATKTNEGLAWVVVDIEKLGAEVVKAHADLVEARALAREAAKAFERAVSGIALKSGVVDNVNSHLIFAYKFGRTSMAIAAGPAPEAKEAPKAKAQAPTMMDILARAASKGR